MLKEVAKQLFFVMVGPFGAGGGENLFIHTFFICYPVLGGH